MCLSLGQRHPGGQVFGPVEADALGLGLYLEHGHTGGVQIAGFQRHGTRDIAARIHGLLIQIDAAERTLGKVAADELERELQAHGHIFQGGDIEFQGIHHLDDLIGHAQQHADVVAVDELFDIGVDIELFYLIRGLGHLAGQGYHLEQGAELIGEHEGDVALGFALDAQHHADILRVRRAGDHRQLERGAIDQLSGSLQTNGDDFIRLFQPGLRGAGQFGLCRGGQHRGHHAQHEGCCEKQRKQSFGLHMDKPPVFIIFSRAGRTG